MKRNNRYHLKPGTIRSLKDLDLERQRLKLEIMKSEEHIHSDYRHLIHALTFRNIAQSVLGNVTHTTSVLSKAFSFGRAIMAKRKKKKKHEGSVEMGLWD